MDDFRQTFLADSIENLDSLRKSLSDESSDHRRQAFRSIHTIKGGLQIFGWRNAAHLAAKIEDLLAGDGKVSDRNLLLESVAQLGAMMRSDKTELPSKLCEKLYAAQPTEIAHKIAVTRISPEIYQKLSPSEQKAIISAVGNEKNIYSAEVVFEMASFAADYRNLRQILEEENEIIAALPSKDFWNEGNIGFQIFFAGKKNTEELQRLTERFAAQISLCNCTETAPNDWLIMLNNLQKHGENLASAANKKITVSIVSNQPEVSGTIVKHIFELLLHLVRNAVDHGIARNGSIEIRIFRREDGWHIAFADDGKSVDLEKIRARAVQKNLIARADVLDEGQLLALIFAPELSTAENLTETSGRGVGLDAVKSLTEKLNGKIAVKSDDSGTVFEIFLPNE